VIDYGFIKICGVTNHDDAEYVADCGASALGLIFAPTSKRVVDPETAAKIIRTTAGRVLSVGVFRSLSPASILGLVERCSLTAVQLHDAADQSLLRSLRASGVTTIISAQNELVTAHNDPALAFYDALLLDGPEPGSGIAPSFATDVFEGTRLPTVLAGGLTPANVVQRIGDFGPWGVDVASGTEASFGVKDHEKVASFVRRAREAFEPKGTQ